MSPSFFFAKAFFFGGILLIQSGASAAPANALPEKKVQSKQIQVPETSNEQAVHFGGGSKTGGYQFNSQGVPANTDVDKRDSLQFKIVDPGAPDSQVSDNPIEKQKNDLPYVAYLGYPKHSFGFVLAPQSVGFSETYGNGPNFNFSSTAPAAFLLNYRFRYSPLVLFEIEYGSYSIKSSAQSLSPYSIAESSVTLDSVVLRGQYCFVGASASLQLCPVLELGQDSFASFEFGTSGLDLNLTKIQDTVLGLSILATYPTNPFWLLKARLGYSYGLRLGQTSALTLKNNSRLHAAAGIERDLQSGHFLEGIGFYDYRIADIEGKVGSITDSWSTKVGNLGMRLGYRYEYP